MHQSSSLIFPFVSGGVKCILLEINKSNIAVCLYIKMYGNESVSLSQIGCF